MLRSILVPFGRLSVYLVVGAVAALMILPFYWMIITAFMPAPDNHAIPPQWIPTR
jgi:ABC-type glycerol-3-phosphate transport system permease component